MTTKKKHLAPVIRPVQLKLIAIWICDLCLKGTPKECHTPGCALYLHHVDLPIHESSYKLLTQRTVTEQ